MKIKLSSRITAEVTPAAGMKGWLLRDAAGEYFFRVYEEGDKKVFHDYDLRIYDLEVTIDSDSDATIYQTARLAFLDHSPRTLGLSRRIK